MSLDSLPGLRERLTALPLDHFPEGEQFSGRKGHRPSGKQPRRPTPSADMRSLRLSPRVAPLDVDRNVLQAGRAPQDNIKDGTPRPRGGALEF